MRFDAGDSTSEGEVLEAKERIQYIYIVRKELEQRLREVSDNQAKYYNKKYQPRKFNKNDL
ncbi:hypothetical protein EG328_003665 [Venturia inaequalis]|uniref:Uncharacterized protein n=1 Tax=Venturia inaequalis TaxID=5025 RepID=A0A8H3UQK0_VENIN|nr:hypothetical protein EG328_003665 [Venturia inaequalis]